MDDQPGVSPEDVHTVAFSNPARGHRGYHRDEVDALLERVEATLRNPAALGVTTAEIQNVTFSKPPIGRRGYNEDEVDVLLGRVAAELARRTGQPGQEATGPRHLKPSNESTVDKSVAHMGAFLAEFGNHADVTWRAPLVIGLLFLFLGFAVHPAFLAVAGLFFVWAAFAWRLDW